jgi:hypothetical protein
MFSYIINFGFPLQASRDIRVDRKVALTVGAQTPFCRVQGEKIGTRDMGGGVVFRGGFN